MRVSTLLDGTLRLVVDIEPRNANDAFQLFGAPGRAVALCALLDGAGAVPNVQVVQVERKTAGHAGATPETGIPVTEKPKGGEWAKLAGMWCADPDFWAWADGTTHAGLFWHVTSAHDASEFVRGVAEIKSRSMLDHDAEAFARFNGYIRLPFMAWMKEQGIQK